MTKKYKPPSKLAERTYKALQTLGMTVIPEYDKLGERLRVDFVVRELGLAIEVQGSQHTEFSKLYHGNQDGFRNSQKRDNRKKVLCEEQGLKLIELSESEIMNASGPEDLAKLILQKHTELAHEEEW